MILSEDSQKETISEKLVKLAFKNLDWHMLQSHFEQINIDDIEFKTFLGHLVRASNLIFPYPNKVKEIQRDLFFDSLKDFVQNELGDDAVASLKMQLSLLKFAEDRYRSILEFLEKCEISKLLPEARISSCIYRACAEFSILINEFHDTLNTNGTTHRVLQSPIKTDKDGHSFSIDDSIECLISELTSTIIMESYKNDWFDPNGQVVLPGILNVDEDEIYKAGSTQLLANIWYKWRKAEERLRFLGVSLVMLQEKDLPSDLRNLNLKHYVVPATELEKLVFVSSERLKNRIIQTYTDLLVSQNCPSKFKNVNEGCALPPDEFISIDEIHSGVVLSELLSYNAILVKEKVAGLRLAEWLRGYSCLKAFVTEEDCSKSDSKSLLVLIPKQKLEDLLVKNGLVKAAAKLFLSLVSLNKNSQDLFDTPLIKLGEENYIIFAPALINTSLAQVILSNISSRGIPLSRKGKAFEKDILSFLNKNGYLAKQLKFKIGGDEYEYDGLFLWDDYLFVLECKNHSLANNNPVQTYYLELEIETNIKQLTRLVEGLKSHSKILEEKLGISLEGKKIVPCLINSLPFSIPGNINGIYFIDSSLFKRFFEERYFFIKSIHPLKANTKLLFRQAVHSSWSDEKPTPKDFLKFLEDPYQLKFICAHSKNVLRNFSPKQDECYWLEGFCREEISIESLAKLNGVSVESLLKELEYLKNQIEEVREKSK